MTLTYYYKDDKVLRQTANNKFDYAAVGVKSKEEAKASSALSARNTRT